MDQAQQIKKRLAELQNRGTFGGYTVYTDFLGLEEQSLLAGVTGPRSVPAYGGFDGAERVMAAFGPAPEPEDYPITCLHIAPKQEKFAEELTHRDYLGTLMGLGLERRVLGDILPCGKGAYLFCTAGMAEYIETQLHRVRHTEVTCTRADHLPPHLLPQPEDREVIVPSLRLDVLVGAVYNLSRSSADKFFLQQKVFVNGRCIENRAHTVQPGDKISVRGHGRFTAGAPLRRTKKRPAGGAGRSVLNQTHSKRSSTCKYRSFLLLRYWCLVVCRVGVWVLLRRIIRCHLHLFFSIPKRFW